MGRTPSSVGTLVSLVFVQWLSAIYTLYRLAQIMIKYQAIDTIRQATRAMCEIYRRYAVNGTPPRHDHGSQFILHVIQGEFKFLGIQSSPSFVRSLEGDGCVERFIRTFKEQLLWLKWFATIDEFARTLKDSRIDTTMTESSNALATRRPRKTDAVSSWRLTGDLDTGPPLMRN